ncbi:MAG: IPT/TIG domain-containing protein [Actinomycetes bacterium]
MSGSRVRRIGATAFAGVTAGVLLVTAGAVTTAISASASNTTSAGCSTSLKSAPTRMGHIGGIAHAARTSASNCSGTIGRDPAPNAGSPPLIFHGGTVMATKSSADKNVITPIFWTPSGFPMDATYKSVLNKYLADAAADSEKSTNVFSTLMEYSGTNGFVNYSMKRGAPIVDTTAFPAHGCVVDAGPVYSDNSGYTTCLDDAQLQTEINSVVTAHSFKRDLGHMYVIFLPKHVESCFNASTTTNSIQGCTINLSPSAGYCAYHGFFNSGGNTVYANMPFPIYASPDGFTCGSDAAFPTNESPNGNTDADVETSPTSHEISEAMTDWDVNTGWYDSSGYENGDECAYTYGATAGAAGALYNQTINGHHYLTQEEFSNNNFNLGQGGCLQTYIPAAKPAITKMSSHAGTTAGGAKVTITGTTLAGADSVKFGTTSATFTIVDPTHIKVTTPAHTAGLVDVTVHNSLGTSTLTAADHYTYS